MVKTMAVQRLDGFISDNYEKLFRAAAREVGENDAIDVIHMTYLKLVEKEERGVGCFDSDYGSTYEAYIFGAMYGVLRGLRKVSPEISEASMTTCGDDQDESPLTRSLARSTSDYCGDRLETAGEVVAELVHICDECRMNILPVVNAVRAVDKLPKTTSYLTKIFSPLRKAARCQSGIASVVEDFIRIYDDSPQEVEACLVEFGVIV